MLPVTCAISPATLRFVARDAWRLENAPSSFKSPTHARATTRTKVSGPVRRSERRVVSESIKAGADHPLPALLPCARHHRQQALVLRRRSSPRPQLCALSAPFTTSSQSKPPLFRSRNEARHLHLLPSFFARFPSIPGCVRCHCPARQGRGRPQSPRCGLQQVGAAGPVRLRTVVGKCARRGAARVID